MSHLRAVGFKKCSHHRFQGMMRKRYEGCRISLRCEVSLMITPPSLLPSTQWDQTLCLKMLSLWKEKWMLCPVRRAIFVVAELLHPISIRWNVARDVGKCKTIRDNYDLYQPQRLKLSQILTLWKFEQIHQQCFTHMCIRAALLLL